MNRIHQAKHILKMIEGCTEDTGKEVYNEISASLECILNGHKFKSLERWVPCGKYRVKYFADTPDREHTMLECGMYTHCRTTLKQARPEGWFIEISHVNSGFDWGCTMESIENIKVVGYLHGTDKGFMTEELAELHAIIQAWIYIWEGEDGL